MEQRHNNSQKQKVMQSVFFFPEWAIRDRERENKFIDCGPRKNAFKT